jgi:hypothetical protein
MCPNYQIYIGTLLITSEMGLGSSGICLCKIVSLENVAKIYNSDSVRIKVRWGKGGIHWDT